MNKKFPETAADSTDSNSSTSSNPKDANASSNILPREMKAKNRLWLEREGIRDLLAIEYETNDTTLRNQIIFIMMYELGLVAKELSGLRISDFDLENLQLTVHRLRPKKHFETLDISQRLRDHLVAWKKINPDGSLLRQMDSSGNIVRFPDRGFTAYSISRIVTNAGLILGMGHFSPSDFRVFFRNRLRKQQREIAQANSNRKIRKPKDKHQGTTE